MTEQRPLAELHAVSDRLWHEYWMLRCVARTAADDAATAHALEESFALHLRNLYRFLRAGPSGDAITAGDFLGAAWSCPEPSALLLEAVAWAERTLSPLRHEPAGAAVGSRGSGSSRDSSGPLRSWTLLQASFELQKLMDPFISSTPRRLLGPRWKIVYEGVVV
ncbi:MAG TPA: hypothetical protein VIC71_09765 [Gammaproteobacteria bacterium]|jgi:hypothetical protein